MSRPSASSASPTPTAKAGGTSSTRWPRRADAILIAGSGTPAALPQKTLKERGYAGKIYQTHGVANNDFLRVCGKDCEGTLLPAGPVLVAAQLPADHPVKKSAMAYVEAYEKVHGKGSTSTFGAHAWDTGVLLQAAFNMSPNDHLGLDQRAAVMVMIKDGTWVLQK